MVVLLVSTSMAQRQMENLDRGVVAVRKSSSDVFVSWRLLGLDPSGIQFNLYRSANGGAWSKLNGSPLSGGCNYTDSSANLSLPNTYRINPVIGGVEQGSGGEWTLPANAETGPLFRIPLRAPYDHRVHQVWPGDVDGDGEYELFASLVATNSTDSQKLAAYKLDGTFLWEMDFGPNSIAPSGIYPSASAIAAGQWDGITVYDLDGDGRAEVIVKSANGVIFGDGTTLNYGDDLTQFISVLDGKTGAEKARIELPNPWKYDNYYPLGTLFGIGYPDGERPSLMIHAKNRTGGSGTPFNTIDSAWDYRDGIISNRWSIQWNGAAPGAPESAHQMRIVDVDGDGRDDLVPGIHAVSSYGTLLWDLHDVGLGHGDRFQISDLDPDRPGLEQYGIQQDNPSGVVEYMLDAATGTLLWTNNIGAVVDAARGVSSDIDPTHSGCENWSFYGTRTATGTEILSGYPTYPNLQIWWDGDLLGESLNEEKLDKWNYGSQTSSRLLTAYHYDANAGDRNVPAFYGDILGDWREEMVFESNAHTELIVFTTTYASSTRLYTLAHNPAYRNCMTVKGYIQENLPDYFLGDGMSTPPVPNITYVQMQPPDVSPPTGLTATAFSTNRIDLIWTASTNAITYNVKRSTTNGGPYPPISTGVTGTNYSDIGLDAGTTYYYVVSGVGTNGESPDSMAASATTMALPATSNTVSYADSASGGWDGNTFETLNPADVTASSSFSIMQNSGDGIGQTFDVTNTFEVSMIRLWHLRYNATDSSTIDVYKNVNRDAGSISDYMVASNLVASIVAAPTVVNSDGTQGDVLEIDLAGSSRFTLSEQQDVGGDRLVYYMYIHATAPTAVNWSLLKWNYATTDVYPDGAYAATSGETASRDFGMALVGSPVTVSPYEAWVSGYPGVGIYTAMTNNPDGDALNNLWEFALGGNPDDGNDTGHEPTNLVAQAGGSNWFYYVYPQRIDAAAAGLTYFLEWTTNLTNAWTNAFYEVTGTGLWTGAESEFHAVTNRVSTDPQNAQFLRLKVEYD